MSLSSGGLGVFLVALTTRIDPPLTSFQKWCACAGAIAVSLGVLRAILAWQTDAQRNYVWALGLKSKTKEGRQPIYKIRNRWIQKKGMSMHISRGSFAVGIILSSTYTTARVFGV